MKKEKSRIIKDYKKFYSGYIDTVIVEVREMAEPQQCFIWINELLHFSINCERINKNQCVESIVLEFAIKTAMELAKTLGKKIPRAIKDANKEMEKIANFRQRQKDAANAGEKMRKLFVNKNQCVESIVSYM